MQIESCKNGVAVCASREASEIIISNVEYVNA